MGLRRGGWRDRWGHATHGGRPHEQLCDPMGGRALPGDAGYQPSCHARLRLPFHLGNVGADSGAKRQVLEVKLETLSDSSTAPSESPALIAMLARFLAIPF